MSRSHYKKIPRQIRFRISAGLRRHHEEKSEPWNRPMTKDDRRRYFMLCEALVSETNDNEEMVDALYRILSERNAAFDKLAHLCIEPKFKFFIGG